MQRSATPLLCLLLFMTACGDSSTSPDQDGGPGTVDTFAVQPTTQVAGGMVILDGIDVDRGEALRTARVGGTDATVVAGDGGTFLLAVPSFHDGTDFSPPAGALDVEILDDGIVVARAEGALSVTVPAPAPEASLRMADALGSTSRGVADAALAFIDEPGTEEGFALALRAAVDSLVNGSGDFSLRSQLEALDDDQRGILDRLVAASGVLEAAERAAERANALAAEMRSAPLARTTELTDSELAARMQLQVMLSDLGTDFLNEANGDLGQIMLGLTGVTLTTGITAPGQAVLETVAAVLGLVNFAVNNVVLGYLPARVDTFDLIVTDDFVAPGEVPTTEVKIVASNAPPAITVLDLVDLVLRTLGIAAGSPQADDVVDVVNQVWNDVLSIIRGQLGQYAASHPDADVAFDVASIPRMTWSATVTDTRFVSPLTFTPDVIGPAENEILAWRAALDGYGEGRIYARMRSGPEVTSLPQIPGYTYTAAAFGRDVVQTDEVTVRVAAPFFVTASMDPAISPGGTNGLEVRVGTVTATNDTLYVQGVAVECTADGGSVDPATGVTGPDGRFDTLVTLDAGSSSLTVDVVATDPVGQQVSTTARATSEDQLVVTIDVPERVDVDVDVPVTVTAQILTPQGPVPATGASVTVSGGSGTSGFARGVTDAAGTFATTAILRHDFNEFVVRAEVGHTTLDPVEAEARSLRVDSIELTEFRVVHGAGIDAVWSSQDGIPWTRFVSEGEFDEFNDAQGTIDDVSSASGEGSAGGMFVNGESESSVTLTVDRDGAGGYTSLRGTGEMSAFLTLTDPPDRRYQASSDARFYVRAKVAVWGTPAAWSFDSSSTIGRVYVKITGDGDIGDDGLPLECRSDDGSGSCSSVSSSGSLPPYISYNIFLDFREQILFSDLEGQTPAGTETSSGSFDFEFTASHGGLQEPAP